MAYEVIFLIGRILLGGFYIINGMNHFTKIKMMTEYAKSKKVPLARLSVIISGLLLLLSGLSFLLGIYPYIGVLLISIFFIPTLYFMHNFWSVPKEEKIKEMMDFMKILALLGSVLMFLQIPLPWSFSLTF